MRPASSYNVSIDAGVCPPKAMRFYMSMSTKNLKVVLACFLGLAGAMSVDHWPNHAATLQMILYSAMILFPILFFFWSDKHRPNYWLGMTLIVLVHSIILFGIRSYFPFRTILIILPLLLLEGLALATMMIKLLGDEA
jgi:hypothetical protein